jgi:RNA polymerase sigma-70 factor (ECF subfamily)
VTKSTFDAFYLQHHALIVRFAERRIDGGRADDIAAETFAIAWRRFDEASPPGLPWLYQTARNLIGNAYRRRKREQELTERLHAEPSDPENELAIDVLDALRQLAPKYREVLQLTYWESLSAAEVATVVGCSEPAAWKRISRAKAELREILALNDRKEARIG